MTSLIRIFSSIALAALLALHTACHDNEPAPPHQATLYDIAEIADADASTLHIYRPDADEPIVLTITGNNTLAATADRPAAGSAIFVAYTPLDGQPYTSGAVTLSDWAAITDIPLKQPTEGNTVQGWDSDPVYMMSMWRGGNKIYMRLRLPYGTSARHFTLLLDTPTENDPVPQLYLYHSRGYAYPTFERQYYVAFDIGNLWKRDYIKGVTVNVANSADPALSQFTFHKTN